MENILIVNLTGIIYSGPVVIAMGSKINEYMMKILLIGAKGQLGSQIMHIIKNGKSELGSVPAEVLNAEIIETDVDTLDITNLQMVKESVKTNMPDVVINCAAFTNVDGC